MSNIFITGATGFLGSALISEILSSSNDTVYALVRGKTATDAEKRLMAILEELSDRHELDNGKKDRIKICVGGITHRQLGLDKETLHHLIDNIDTIYHSAAITDLNWPLEKIRKINVDGTKNVLNFAVMCRKNGRLKKVNHISTAYIAGIKRSIFKENHLDVSQEFNNTYEQSKYEAEVLVSKYRKKNLDIDIFRPGIIMGRYKDGKTIKFKMLYQPLHFFALELFDKIPVVKNGKAYLINVDIVARTIFLINSLPDKITMNYHIISPETPTLNYVLDIASEYFGFKKPEFIPSEEIDIYKEYSPAKRKLIEPYLPYLNCTIEFTMENTLNQLQRANFTFPEFDEENLIRLFEYCDKVGFIKRKKKNVTVA